MAMDALRTSDSPMNGGNVPLLFSADCITRLHRTLASLEKGGGKNLQIFAGGILASNVRSLCHRAARPQAAAAATANPPSMTYRYVIDSPLCKGAKRFKRDKYADIDLNHRQYTSCTPGAAGSAFYYHAFLFLLYYIIDIAIEAKV